VPGAVAGGWFQMPGWVLLAAVVMLLLAVAAVAVHRSGVRIRIEREPAVAGPEGSNDAG
jgi:hypothetical protein